MNQQRNQEGYVFTIPAASVVNWNPNLIHLEMLIYVGSVEKRTTNNLFVHILQSSLQSMWNMSRPFVEYFIACGY